MWLLAAPAGGRYDGHHVVRAEPADERELRTLLRLADEVWSERVGLGPVDLRMAPASMAALDASGIDYEVRVADLQLEVDRERARLQARTAPALDAGWFQDFADLAAIEAYLEALAMQRPDIVESIALGTSLEGREIRALRIGPAAAGKSAILYTGTMHAREWLSPMVVTCIADALVEGAGSDDRIDDILAAVDVYVVPVLNPDGYVWSWTGDRYWRKNTRGGFGVDLNRNYGYAWGGQGSSGDPAAENYRGDGPFSEPESAALRDFVIARPELVAHIDVHSYANLVIHPWGHGYEAAPDEAALQSLAGEMADAMAGATGAIYSPIQGADFYPAAGTVDDWSYGDHGMMAFTIELRGNDFVVPPSQIEPACEETLAAALVLAEWAAAQSGAEPPPDDDGDGGSPPGGESDSGGSGDAAPDPGQLPDPDGDATSTAAGPSDGGSADGADAGQGGALPWDYGGTSEGCTCASSPGGAGRRALALLFLVAIGTRRGRRRDA